MLIDSNEWAALGVLVALLAIVVAVAIAWYQRRSQVRDRRKAARGATSEALVREYRDAWTLLDSGAELSWKVAKRGPHTAAGLVTLGIDEFAMRAERLAVHGVEPLRGDLREVVLRTEALKRHVVPARMDTVDGGAWEPADVVAACRAAAAQALAAQSLNDVIGQAKGHLRTRWDAGQDR